MNAQEIFDLAREYGAEHPGITFDLEALLRYTRKVQEMERERAVKQPEKAEPLGPGESWEYDDGLTMNRKIYRHGKLTEVITIEIIQDTPQMRPFRAAYSFGNREHRPAVERYLKGEE